MCRMIHENIYLVTRPTQKELASTFLRFQEYYEGPTHKGKIFTRAEYEKWYTEKYGAFTYCEDWDGFNIPGLVLKPFIEGKFDPLSKEEQQFLEDFVDKDLDSIYIIGVTEGENDSDVYEHEMCHALWYTNKDYYHSAFEIILTYIDEIRPLLSWLTKKGYHDEVIIDEMNAYITTDSEWLKNEHGIKIPKSLTKKLRDLKSSIISS